MKSSRRHGKFWKVLKSKDSSGGHGKFWRAGEVLEGRECSGGQGRLSEAREGWRTRTLTFASLVLAQGLALSECSAHYMTIV